MPDRERQKTVLLIQRARQGERGALDLLFERYLPFVRQVAALRLRTPVRDLGEVEDVVQEALLRAFRGLDRLEKESSGAFRNWLARCVESAIVDRARSARARKRGEGKVLCFAEVGSRVLSTSIFAGREPTPSQVARQAELEERIESALLELPDHHREVIILRKLCGMSYRDVAEALGIEKEGTARQLCARALSRLRELLKE